MDARQLPDTATPTLASSATPPHCTPFTLPSAGVLTLAVDHIITLTSDAVFQPQCTAASSEIVLIGKGSPSLTDFRDPFYASTIPECYALAAATVMAYMLVIMLFITPRTFLREGAVVLGRRGFTNGPSGNSEAGIGIGGRPWLQKVAALTVAISLSIATADTLRVAEAQYYVGYMDAAALQTKVEDSLELKIIRVISDTFLWLAQAQTLIRLFPRQREKIIIKWTAFALITLDVLFSILNNFVYNGSSRPRSFVDAIPALAYLFQLALSLLYAAWVIYYSFTKKRFAFYHPQMKNMILVSLLSLVSVLVPVVFFVLDISKPTLAGWGDYVRWVGAAAASVVVWEWVERIEALERDDKKDGILGREVFDGDEMLDTNTRQNLRSRSTSRKGNGGGGGGGGGSGASTGSSHRSWPTAVSGLANRYRPRVRHDLEKVRAAQHTPRGPRPRPPLWPTRPAAAATPVSRTDTVSADSTVYAVRYHPISEATPSVRPLSRPSSAEITRTPSTSGDLDGIEKRDFDIERMEDGFGSETELPNQPTAWGSLARANPFRKRGREPPPEVSAHTAAKSAEQANAHGPSSLWCVLARLEDIVATQAEKFRDKSKSSPAVGPLPKTIIPAPPRRRDLAATLEELESTEQHSHRTPQTPQLERRLSTRPGSQMTWVPSFIAVDDESESDTIRPPRQRFGDSNGHLIHQRSAISFVTKPPSSSDAVSPISPQSTSPSQRSNPAILRTPTSSRRSDGLPVLSIPAPPRRPRSPSEHA